MAWFLGMKLHWGTLTPEIGSPVECTGGGRKWLRAFLIFSLDLASTFGEMLRSWGGWKNHRRKGEGSAEQVN